jgi:hypothetical protein
VPLHSAYPLFILPKIGFRSRFIRSFRMGMRSVAIIVGVLNVAGFAIAVFPLWEVSINVAMVGH